MYNNMIETIVKVTKVKKKKVYTLSNGVKITESQLKKLFKPAYALTAYGVQGDSINSYYFAPEDTYFLDGRTAYTIISRLRQKIIKKKIPSMFILKF